MEDNAIIALYLARDEAAIRETEQKYGRYLTKIALQILNDPEDGRESVNDTYLRAWNSIPPHRPAMLSTYLGRIVRQAAIDLFRRRHSAKRAAGEYAHSLSELEECLSGGDDTRQTADLHLLGEAISAFLRTLPAEARTVFLERYYFADPLREIAARHRMSESKAKSLLHRTRLRLRDYLEQEGFSI